jgi:hypothetical protein
MAVSASEQGLRSSGNPYSVLPASLIVGAQRVEFLMNNKK